jgi:hypothetical protein
MPLQALHPMVKTCFLLNDQLEYFQRVDSYLIIHVVKNSWKYSIKANFNVRSAGKLSAF